MNSENTEAPNQWYVLLGDKRLGPYAFESLVEAAGNKVLQETDLVGCPGRTTWLIARSVPGLFSPGKESDSFPVETIDLNWPAGLPDVAPSITLQWDQADGDKSPQSDQPDNFIGQFLHHGKWLATVYAVGGASLFILAYIFTRFLKVDLGISVPLELITFTALTFATTLIIIILYQSSSLQSAGRRVIRHTWPMWASLAAMIVIIGASGTPIELIPTLVRNMTDRATDTLEALKSKPAHKIERILSSIPAYERLNQIDPGARNQIVQKLTEQYSNDVTEDQIISRARNMLFKELQPYLKEASDSAVLENIDIIISYMEGLLNTDPESCVSLVDETKGAKLNVNLSRQFRDIFRLELDLHANILRDAKKEGVKAPTERQVQPYLSKVFFVLGSKPGVKLSLLDQPNLAPSDYKDYCNVTLNMFREIRGLPREEAVALLRYLYSLGKR